jgi:hypothetical protein
MDASGSPALPLALDGDRVVIPRPSLRRERAQRFSVLLDVFTAVTIGIVLLARIVFTSRLRGLRRAEIDGRGIFVRSSPFHSFRLEWSDVARVEIDSGTATFTRADGGTHSLALQRFRDGTRIGERLSEAVACWRPEAAGRVPAP